MNKQAREALDAYYVEAESWAQDRQDALRGSRRLAWIVAAAAATIAVLEAIASSTATVAAAAATIQAVRRDLRSSSCRSCAQLSAST